MDPLDETCLSPMKVRSFEKALQLQGIPSGITSIAGNTQSTASLLSDIKTQNTQIISLLQQLVDK